MKKILFLCAFVLLFLIVGCNNIGNGVSTVCKIDVETPQVIDIEGDWRIEIVCGSDVNTGEIVIDENLQSRFFVSSGRKFSAYLPKDIYPMVAPVLRLKLKKSFHELQIEGNSICRIKNYKSDFLETEIDSDAVCVFENCNIEYVNAELSENGKLSFNGEVKKIEAELEDRTLLELENVGNLKLEASDNSVCRVGKCNTADVEAEDNAHIVFKQVKLLEHKEVDNARVDYPVVIPEELKK